MAYQSFWVISMPKSSLQIDWLVRFNGMSTTVGYLMPNPLYLYILNIYDLVWSGFMAYQPLSVTLRQILFIHIYQTYMIWFGWVLWYTNHCRFFNAKSSLYIHIKYIWFCLVGFCGISTIVGYLMPNALYTYILNILDLIWLGFMKYQPL